MRLIDADALLEKLRKTDRYFMLKFDIESAPTVIPEDFMNPYEEGYERARKDFERPQGKWIDHIQTEGYVECPFCHKKITGGDLNFCVKCGAKLV